MAFTPNEIRNKEFTRVKNGLEPAEVSDFLTQLSNEIERLKEEKKQLEKVLEERDTNIKSYQDVHQSVSDALIQAQQAGEQTKIAATKESAKTQADVIVNDAIEKARHLSFQTEDMKRQSKIFRSRFRMLVEAQLDLLKNDDWDYLLNYDFDAEQVTQENIQHLNPQDVNPNANNETPTSETTETVSNEGNQSINSNETTNTSKSTSENKDVSSSESSSNK